MSLAKESIGTQHLTPGYSITKSTMKASSRPPSLSASKNRTSVTKSFGRSSRFGWDEDGDTTKGVKELLIVSSSRPSRLSALISQTIYEGGQEEEDPYDVNKVMCIPLTNNVKALFIMMVMFAAISIGQYFAAAAANSQSLKADVISMAVDALSYLGNILGEGSDIPSQRIVLQLFFSTVSIVLLLYFNTTILIESIAILKDNEDSGEDEEEGAGVEGSLVFSFATLGLIFDAICLYAYYYYAKKDADAEYKIMKAESAAASGAESSDQVKIQKPQINMLTALLHVSADLLRSTVTFILGIILMTGKLPPSGEAYVDAIGGIIIGASLYAAVAYATYEWCLEFWGWFTNLGASINVCCPECNSDIVIKPDKAGHSKAADAFLG